MEKDKSDKKDHILDVAEKVFSDLGYDAASTRTISGEAGVNMAMLNYYFGSKEGLFLAVFERKIEMFRSMLQNLGNDASMNAWDKLDAFIEAFINKVVVNSCFAKLINREMSLNRRDGLMDKIGDILLTNVLEVKKIIDDGKASGQFRQEADTEMAVATIFGTKNYITNTSLVASKMLGNDVNDAAYMENELKPRIKKYLKELLKAYLLK
ncbi:TetR/AcrR family transcriptional regulator [Mucilaginibacter limnophilus]|uniref:TetR/AcrR family transcriptional regulator n=1 Tax=Mucilaginibacter limnophilus TaxID=1932778 RepID=A0A437MRV9_9SPHI|nr:TetR/AcrR family transcriptional regulator [Mucilaginibacter limnophilus]RVU00392.1 TetR/AcrR family transcriptional regulator [Mucilaginibacter limnophilus]